MKFIKKPLLAAIAAGTMLMGTGCADDQMAKGLLVLGGAGAGAFIGTKVAPEHKMMGAVLGAGAGGVLGFALGGLVGKK
jgi:hypothetical protein